LLAPPHPPEQSAAGEDQAGKASAVTNYDAGGRVFSRETTTANTTTTFRDSSGRTTGRAATNGNTLRCERQNH